MSGNKVDGSGDTPYMLFGNVYSDPGTFEDKVGTKLNKIAAQGGSDEPENFRKIKRKKKHQQMQEHLICLLTKQVCFQEYKIEKVE